MALQEFISYVKDTGIARNNRYEVSISAPKINISISAKDKESLFVKSVDIPTLSLMTWEHNVYGEFRTVPYQKRYEPFSVTFYVDTKFDVKKVFDDWMNKVYDPINRTSGYYDDYARFNTLNLTVYNVGEGLPPDYIPKGSVYEFSTYNIKFHEVYPKAVQQIQLDASRRDAMTLTVVFNYKWFDAEAIRDFNMVGP